MGGLGSIGHAVGKAFSSATGGILNDLTGVTSAGAQSQKYALQSAAQQYKYNTKLAAQEQKYALESAAINNKYQKEFAKNSHQWAMQDLKKAGLNPVLAAGGGASASGGGVSAASVGSSNVGSASVSGAGINPIQAGLDAWGSITDTKNTAAQTSKIEAETENVNTDTLLKSYQTLTEIEKIGLTKAQAEQVEAMKKAIIAKLPHEIGQIEAETKYTNERARGHSTTYSGNVGITGGGATYSVTK